MITGKLPYEPHCARCAAKLDGYGGQDGTPSPGDFTICLYCGAIMEFTDHQSLVERQFKDLPEDVKPMVEDALDIFKFIQIKS